MFGLEVRLGSQRLSELELSRSHQDLPVSCDVASALSWVLRRPWRQWGGLVDCTVSTGKPVTAFIFLNERPGYLRLIDLPTVTQ